MKTMNIFKKAVVAAMVVTMLMCNAMPAMAAGWQKNNIGWWYGTNDDNTTWYANGWQWIDGNGDGLAECYCFDSNGYMYENTTTPDGYTVNADGAWVENGVVQTKMVAVPAPQPVQNPNHEGCYDVHDYDSMGLSKAAVDIALHTREENAKYTETALTGTQNTTVQYANGLYADYYMSKNNRPTRVYAENDSTMIFQHHVDCEESDVARLKAKGYAFVSWMLGGIYVQDIWDGRVSIQFVYPDCYMTVLTIKGRHRSDGVHMDAELMNAAQLLETLGATWGSEWGY